MPTAVDDASRGVVFSRKKYCAVCVSALLGVHLLRPTDLTASRSYVYVSSFVIEIDCYRVQWLLLAVLLVEPSWNRQQHAAAAAARSTCCGSCSADVLRVCERKRRRPRGTQSVTRSPGRRAISASAAAAAVSTARKRWSRAEGFRRRAVGQDVTSTRPAANHWLTWLNRAASLITNAPSINYLPLSPLVVVQAIAVPSAPLRFTDRCCPSVRPSVHPSRSLSRGDWWARATDTAALQLNAGTV